MKLKQCSDVLSSCQEFSDGSFAYTVWFNSQLVFFLCNLNCKGVIQTYYTKVRSARVFCFRIMYVVAVLMTLYCFVLADISWNRCKDPRNIPARDNFVIWLYTSVQDVSPHTITYTHIGDWKWNWLVQD